MTYTPSFERARDMYSWALRWDAGDHEDRPDLAKLQVDQRAEFDRMIAARDQARTGLIAAYVHAALSATARYHEQRGESKEAEAYADSARRAFGMILDPAAVSSIQGENQ